MSALPALQGPAQCPACGAALPKMPQRKTKCRACGQFMYVRSTPDDRIKRPMTEAEAMAAEALWADYRAEQVVDDMGMRRGFTREEWRLRIATQGGNRPAHEPALQRPVRDQANRLYAAQYQEMEGYLRREWDAARQRHGMPLPIFEITKPKQYGPNSDMRRLFDAGRTIPDIARSLALSVQTVADTLATGGIHWRVGAHCDELEGMRCNIEEAVAQMPLPCGAGCVCSWRYIHMRIGTSPAQVVDTQRPSQTLSAENLEEARQAWSNVLGVELPKAEPAVAPLPWWRRIFGNR